jgi:hypothetical protein
MRFTRCEFETDRHVGIDYRMNLAGQSTSRPTHGLFLVASNARGVLMNAHNGRIDGIMAQTPQAAGRWYNETASRLLLGPYVSEFAANPKVDHFGMDCCRFAIGDSDNSLRFKCFC